MTKRGPGKLNADYTSRDIYKQYKKDTPKDIQVSYDVFNKVTSEFNKLVLDKVLNESEQVKFPCGLGTLRIKKTKMKFNVKNKKRMFSPDWVKTKEVGKLVYHMNEHRNGYRYRFHWDKKKSRIKNKKHYSFITARSPKRRLAHILKNMPEREYFE